MLDQENHAMNCAAAKKSTSTGARSDMPLAMKAGRSAQDVMVRAVRP